MVRPVAGWYARTRQVRNILRTSMLYRYRTYSTRRYAEDVPATCPTVFTGMRTYERHSSFKKEYGSSIILGTF